MKEKTMPAFVTINHLDDYQGTMFFKVGDELILKKDKNNEYDDEAIIVYDKHETKSGYVANSVRSVIRGTSSAGRIYDKIEDGVRCVIRFIYTEEAVIIAELL